MTFTPSLARTVTVNALGTPFTAGVFWVLTAPSRPRGPKDPDATTDFTFDWAPWLLDSEDSIKADGLEFLVDEGLVVEGKSFTGSKCTVFLSGGTLSKRATVTCRITTVSVPPRIEDRSINLDIESR